MKIREIVDEDFKDALKKGANYLYNRTLASGVFGQRAALSGQQKVMMQRFVQYIVGNLQQEFDFKMKPNASGTPKTSVDARTVLSNYLDKQIGQLEIDTETEKQKNEILDAAATEYDNNENKFPSTAAQQLAMWLYLVSAANQTLQAQRRQRGFDSGLNDSPPTQREWITITSKIPSLSGNANPVMNVAGTNYKYDLTDKKWFKDDGAGGFTEMTSKVDISRLNKHFANQYRS